MTVNTHDIINTKNFLQFYKNLSAKDGYTVIAANSNLDKEYNANEFLNLCDDFTGYEVIQISQTNARKQRVHFVVIDKK